MRPFPARLVRALPLIACLATLPACRQEKRIVVGVVPKGANHIFWQTVHAGAIKAAREYGFDIEWNAPSIEVDSSRQIDIVESMVNRRLAGIVLAPVDRKALVNVIERAHKAGIPVAIFDSGVDTDKRITFVVTNNEEGGRMAARRMGEILGGKGKVAIIGFMPGSASTMEREHGFEDELNKKYPGIRVVALQFGMADRAKSLAVTENILTAHPDLNGIFADNESSSVGASQALKSRGLRQVKMVAFDASEQLAADMKAGWIDSMVVQSPFRMGYESTRAIGMHLRGEKVPPHIDSGVAIVLASEVDKPEIRELLFPDIRQYLSGGAAR